MVLLDLVWVGNVLLPRDIVFLLMVVGGPIIVVLIGLVFTRLKGDEQ